MINLPFFAADSMYESGRFAERTSISTSTLGNSRSFEKSNGNYAKFLNDM